MMKTFKHLLLALACLTNLLAPAITGAQNQACQKHFVDGKAPSFTRASLQQKTAGLCYDAFAVMHSGVSRTPLWSAERLTRESIAAAKEVRRKDAFHAEEALPPTVRAELSDYARSGYDRGHMSPAADMPTEEAQHQSFSLANIVPQDRENNQRLWSAIEGATRHLANQRGEIFVITGPLFEGERIQRINGRVFVPTHVFKAIYDPAKKEGAAWLAPNAAGDTYEVMSLAELEKRAGINLFPAVPDSVKTQVMPLPEPRLRKR
ncbi:MAG: DNA/RNA non-specific endonuclease [Oxalobacteraceae bacterium]|nr:DNA/RNA non-specific endonuclease [Oxalobacteraceae bacterium]